jgi:hypothetical protein
LKKLKKIAFLFFLNVIETEKMTGIYDIDKSENYKEVYAFSIKQIRKMYKDDEIYEIERNE